MENLDSLLHQPLRTQLAAYLAGAREASFSELKRNLQVSDGNLESHLKKLIAADYVSQRRVDGPGRGQTVYSLSATGLAALQHYVDSLRRLLPLDETQAASAPHGLRDAPV